jgi:hypothetical protein
MSDTVIHLDRAAKSRTSGNDIHNYEAMLERARALVPTLKARAAETEQLRRLPLQLLRKKTRECLRRICSWLNSIKGRARCRKTSLFNGYAISGPGWFDRFGCVKVRPRPRNAGETLERFNFDAMGL